MVKQEQINTDEARAMAQAAATAASTAAAQAAATAVAQAATAAAVVGADIKYIQRDISEIKDIIKNLGSEFVTKSDYEPVKRIVYGMVTLILSSVIIGLLAVVLKK